MSKYSESPRSEEIAREEMVVDPETGEILQIQISEAESLAVPEGARGYSPSKQVPAPSKPGGKSLGAKVRFLKVKPLGARVMATARLTARQYQVFLLLLSEAQFGGRCYTHPNHIGKDLEMDPSDVRKAIKALEQHQLVFKTIMKNKGHCYTLNPHYVTVGSEEEEAAAQASWSIERIKRMKECSTKPVTSRA